MRSTSYDVPMGDHFTREAVEHSVALAEIIATLKAFGDLYQRRDQIVLAAAGAGVSVRQIASLTGLGHATVSRIKAAGSVVKIGSEG